MGTPIVGHGPVKARGGELVIVQFVIDASATPAVSEDLDGIIDTDTGITDNGAGDYTIPLARSGYRLYPVGAQCEASSGQYACNVVGDPSADPQTLRLRVYDTSGGALADPSADVVVTCFARRTQ